MSEIGEFIAARIAEEREAIPERGDDPFTPHGQHWSEIPFPMAAAAQALNVLDHLQAIADIAQSMANGPVRPPDPAADRARARTEFPRAYDGARILAEVASVWHEHPDFRPEWST